MDSLLLLAHRLPWPPDKGDKIRSYHVLRHLAQRYRVYLGSFIDDPDDWRHVPAVEALCAGTCIRPLRPWQSRWRALGALARGEALTVGCYRDGPMQRWVDGLVGSGKIDVALCYSSGVAPFLMQHDRLPRVMDFVDADSDKWQQYAREPGNRLRLLWRREARCLERFEREVATRFDASVFVSAAEAEFFARKLPTRSGQIYGVANGVDAAYWDPQGAYPDPYPAGGPVLAFVGAMDYRANVHGAQWFVERVWPRILARYAQARFYIVGSRPTREVRALQACAGVTVTGRVEDVRPYLAHAHAVATPLQIARGIQNKVLEALAMEKPVLATPAAWEGIEGSPGPGACITDSPERMAEQALHWLQEVRPLRMPALREMVLAGYDWAGNLDAYARVLAGVRMGASDLSNVSTAVPEACP